LLLLSSLCNAAFAQEDWKESPTPTPPAYSRAHLIEIEMPGSALKYGIDPSSVSIGEDGVLRYVMLAYSASGSVNALFEGLRCETRQVKTYARSTAPGQWTLATDPQWKTLSRNSASTSHAAALARQGVCDLGQLSAKTAPELIRQLRQPPQAPGN
jgi:hypothetical protein